MARWGALVPTMLGTGELRVANDRVSLRTGEGTLRSEVMLLSARDVTTCWLRQHAAGLSCNNNDDDDTVVMMILILGQVIMYCGSIRSLSIC